MLDLASGEVIAEESEATPGGGFCPVGFYVPDWWDVHDGGIIPGSAHWDRSRERPDGEFGYVKPATGDYVSPCFEPDAPVTLRHPPFIEVRTGLERVAVTLAMHVEHDLASGAVVPEELDYDRATGELIPGPD